MEKKGYKVKVVIEGAATKLIPEISLEGNPANRLYLKEKEQNLIGGVCRACSVQMKVLDAVKTQGLPILDDMSGHSGMSKYLDDGYEIITL